MQDFGAFVDVGVCKDGLLHVSEADIGAFRVADLREHLKVGDTLRVRVKSIEEACARFALTCRAEPPPRRETEPRPDSQRAAAQGWRARPLPDKATDAAQHSRAVEASRLERLWKGAEHQRSAEAERRAAGAARHAEEERKRDRLAAIEAEERFASAEAHRLAASLPTAAEALCGTPLPPPPPPPLEVVVSKVIHGKVRHLYKMPWKEQIASEYGGVLSIVCAA